MANGASWTFDDQDADLRHAALSAARAAGMSVQEWLQEPRNRALNEPRRQERRSFRAKRGQRHELSPLDRVMERLQDETAARESRVAEDRLAAAIGSLEGRIRSSEEKTAAALLQIGSRLAEPRQPARAEPVRRPIEDTALTQSLTQIVGRLGDIERRMAQPKEDPALAIQKSLRDLEARLATLPQRAAEQAVEKAASRIEKHEPPEAIRTIESKLGAILDALNTPRAPAQSQGGGRPRPPGLTAAAIGSAVAEIGQRQRKLDTDFDLSRQTESIDRLRSELGEISRRLGERTDSQDVLRHMREEVATLSRTIAARAGEDPGIATLRDELRSLGRAVDGLAPRHLVASLDVAMQDLVQRIDRSRDEGVREAHLKPIETLLGDLRAEIEHLREPQSLRELSIAVRGLMDRLDSVAARGPDQQALRGIEGQIAELRNVIGRPQSGGSLDQIATEVAGLGRKLDQLASRPEDRGAGRDIATGIDEIRRLVDTINPSGQLARIESRLDDLTRRLDREPADRIEDRLLDHIDARLGAFQRDVAQHLAEARPAVVDTGAAALATAEIAARIDRLAAMVEMAGHGAPVSPPPADLSGLEPLLQSLVRRIEETERPTDTHALDQLQRDINAVMARVETLPSAGQDVRQLHTMVEQLVSDLAARERETVAMAEQAARRAVEGVTANTRAGETGAVASLQRDLSALRDSQTDAERRTHVTLEAVHDTLERMVDRLGEIERDMRKPPAVVVARAAETPPPVFSAPAEVAPVFAPVERPVVAEPSPHVPVEAGLPRVAPFAPTIPPVLPTEPDIAPARPAAAEKPAARNPMAAALDAARDAVGALRPGQGLPKAAAQAAPTVETPVQRQAAAPLPQPAPAMPAAAKPAAGKPAAANAAMQGDIFDLPLEPGSGRPSGQPRSAPPPAAPALETDDPKANFIAAARRAAQAAAAQSAEFIAEDKKAGGLKARLSDVKAGGVKRKHVLLLGLAALVVIVGATYQVMTLRKPTGVVGANPPAIEAPASPEVAAGNPAVEAAPSVRVIEPAQPAPVPPAASPPVEAPKASERVSSNVSVDPAPVGALGTAAGHTPLDRASPLARFEGLSGAERLRAAALAGDPAAFYELGARYAEGRGARRDPRLAIQWLEKAAEMGSAPASYRLGGHHREGRGTERNARLALDHFTKAAEAGHSRAMHNVAVLLAEGVRGSPDYAGAAQWFKRASELGIRDSQYNLAILHARGLGVPQDLVASYAWFAAAARQGDDDAGKKRDEVGARLTPEQLTQAKAAAAAWRPTTADPAANTSPTPAGGWDQAQPAPTPAQPQRPRPNRT